jgi:hypothetical protein
MKKIVLMMLVAMVPFLTIAQKRSKKGNKQAIEQEEQAKLDKLGQQKLHDHNNKNRRTDYNRAATK